MLGARYLDLCREKPIQNKMALLARAGMGLNTPEPCKSIQRGTTLTPGSLLGTAKNCIAIGGHRGCGENLLNAEQHVVPKQRENTCKSFQDAVKLGCSFVEFDVQVTADSVPVIWHDDEILTNKGQGACTNKCEVKDLTLAEFKGLVCKKEPGWVTEVVRQFRSKVTRQGVPGDRPWVCSSDDVLPTLQELFEAVPEHVGFDLEVKMTVPDSVEATSRAEVERVVRPILECVEACTAGSSRTLVFSSFDPDICIELCRQQSKYPVMFLSGCGLYPHVDARRTSIAQAIEVAASHGMAGIVVPANVLMQHQGMVADAGTQGLLVLTYGLDNDDMDSIIRQQELGVHAAIVDDVAHVMQALCQSC